MDITQLKSIKDVKKEDIFKVSGDGQTIITNDGTKVSDDLIAQAKAEAKATSAAAGAARASGVSLEDPAFTEKVDAIAEAAARRVLNEFRAEMEKPKK